MDTTRVIPDAPSIYTAYIYSNCTDTFDPYAPHYRPLENRRLRRGLHAAARLQPAITPSPPAYPLRPAPPLVSF